MPSNNENMSNITINTSAIPTIALRGLVVLPDTSVSLDIGRLRSIAALLEAVSGDKFVFLLTQKNIADTDPEPEQLHGTGVVARVIHHTLGDDGAYAAVFQVLFPARVKKLVRKTVNSHFFAEIEPFEYTTTDVVVCEAFLRKARELLTDQNLGAKNREKNLKLASIYEPDKFVNICATEYAYKDIDKQRLLETVENEARLEHLCGLITLEVELAKVERRIAGRVKRQMDKGQKEYYLKEQMHAIAVELGEGDDSKEIELKIKQAHMPEEVEQKAQKELARLRKMQPTSPDAGVSRTYIEWLCDMPWDKFTKDNQDLKLARKILDEDHFGLEKIKQRIIEYLAVMQLSGKLNGPILCFVGPPGVGKTSIVKSIARAQNRKYVRMSLGGVRDEAEIRGHRRTYVGSIPGKIIYLMKQAGASNPVMLFDEIDKMSSDFRGDPASAMLEVLDPEQNYSFVDHYMEVPFDLSKTLFVCTANSVESIPPALLDRMEVIELSGYSEEEKIQIAKRFLIEKQRKLHGIKKSALKISDTVLRRIVCDYTRESGVRTLEREIATICRKIALKCIEEPENTFSVSAKDLEEYLGVAKFKRDFVGNRDEVGSATGLAWTVVGGTTLKIDVTLFEGKGDVLLTGMLGDVMKESARTAISLVRSRAVEYDINPEIFTKTDIHIHIPEGATPKDGPSAGITMATAIMSAFSKHAVSGRVAMTGEVTLRGKVLPIGGLKEKTLAAYRAGIRTIIIPTENEPDIKEIPKEVTENINFILADDISTVFSHGLV